MKYKVLIKKCEDPQRASRIAEEIARWSGSTADVVYGVITQKPVCIRKEAEKDEALRLKGQFEAVGAEVELVAIGGGVAPVTAVAAGNTAATMKPSANKSDDDDDEPGRVLTDAEYTQRLRERADIFALDRDTRLRNIELVSLILGVLFGIYLSTREIVTVQSDFFEKIPEERVAKLVKEEISATLEEKKKEEKKPEEELKKEKKSIKPKKNQGSGGMQG